MGKRQTHNEFLDKLLLKNKHFKNGEFKVLSKIKSHPEPMIVKDKYGYCKMTANSLLKGSKPSISGSIYPKNYLINKLRDIRKDFYRNELRVVGDYIRDSSFILVEDKFGICNSLISNMYKGRGLSIGSAIDKTKYFINQAEYKIPNVFIFNETVYGDDGDDEITIECKKHGKFKTTPNIFLQRLSCIECTYEKVGDSRRSNNTRFKEKSVLLKGDDFNYEYVEYIDAHTPVKIKCNKEGHIFEQRPNNFFNSQYCPECYIGLKTGSINWWCKVCENKIGILYIY